MGKTILEKAIECMDASVDASGEDFTSNSDLLQQIDELMTNHRQKWEIPLNVEIGNADAYDTEKCEEIGKDHDKLELEIFSLCWSFMCDMMVDLELEMSQTRS